MCIDEDLQCCDALQLSIILLFCHNCLIMVAKKIHRRNFNNDMFWQMATFIQYVGNSFEKLQNTFDKRGRLKEKHCNKMYHFMGN